MANASVPLLHRLAAAVAALPSAPAAPGQPAVTKATAAPLIEQFKTALEQRGATWEMAENAVAARLRLAGQLHEEGVTEILAWAGDQLPVDGMLDALEVLGIEVIVPEVPGSGHAATLARLAEVETGLTAAEAGIASTGSLVLRGGPGRPQVVSQLPRRLITLLPAAALFASPESWLAAGSARYSLHQSSTVALISGPSLSEDVELLPALGVHGPRRLHVILIDQG